jgi:hypothetical protein
MDVKNNKITQLGLNLASGGASKPEKAGSYRRMARNPDAQTREII